MGVLRFLYAITGWRMFVPKPKASPDDPTWATTNDRLVDVFRQIRTFIERHPGATILSADDETHIVWTAYKLERGREFAGYWSVLRTRIEDGTAYEGLNLSVREKLHRIFQGPPEDRLRIAEWLATGQLGVDPKR